jgi:AbrB family looped-hinge helix DNA binding protein
MPTVKEITLSAKGQIVIPADLREALGLEAGDRLLIRQDGQALTLERRQNVLGALEGKYAMKNRSLSKELSEERRAEAKRK